MERRPIDRLIQPFQVFAAYKLSGAILLIAGAVFALIWANSPWAESYAHLLHLPVSVGFADFSIQKSLLHWINDGLMGVFFFHVGLEIKREVRDGELSTARKAALPATAALGGMIVPAGLYALLNWGEPGLDGWGIPMATDIAFALGVLALLGDRVPIGLKVFLTALAIVDDIGAVLVIAIFYTDTVSLVSLAIGAAFFVVAVGFNRLHVRSIVAYLVVGLVVWVAFLKSGVHATVAALIMAFVIPSRTQINGAALIVEIEGSLRRLRQAGIPRDTAMNTPEQQHVLDDLQIDLDRASSPLLKLEHGLVPLVAFLILPIFALANAGVAVGGSIVDSLTDPIALGIILGLFVGKQIGVLGFAWLAVRLRLADLPKGVSWSQVHAAGLLAGIGFTMSLFIAGLAFDDARMDTAKIGILSGSLVSGLVGYLALRRALNRIPVPEAEPEDAEASPEGGSAASAKAEPTEAQ